MTESRCSALFVILVLLWLLGGVVKGNMSIAEHTTEEKPCARTTTCP